MFEAMAWAKPVLLGVREEAEELIGAAAGYCIDPSRQRRFAMQSWRFGRIRPRHARLAKTGANMLRSIFGAKCAQGN